MTNQDELQTWTKGEIEAATDALKSVTSPLKHGRGYWVTALHVLVDRRICELQKLALNQPVETSAGARAFHETRGQIMQLEKFKEEGFGFLDDLLQEEKNARKP